MPVEKKDQIVYKLSRAGVAELADALDSKSSGPKGPCGFDSLLRHQFSPDFGKISVVCVFSLS